MPKAVQLVFIMKHGTSLNVRLPWDPINFIMVKHSLHIRFQCCNDVFVLGSPKQLSVSVLQIVVWNYVEKNSDLYLPFFSVAVLFEPSALCEIDLPRKCAVLDMWYASLKKSALFVDIDFSINIFSRWLRSSGAAAKIKNHAIYWEADIWVRKKRVYLTISCPIQVGPCLV